MLAPTCLSPFSSPYSHSSSSTHLRSFSSNRQTRIREHEVYCKRKTKKRKEKRKESSKLCQGPGCTPSLRRGVFLNHNPQRKPLKGRLNQHPMLTSLFGLAARLGSHRCNPCLVLRLVPGNKVLLQDRIRLLCFFSPRPMSFCCSRRR